MKALVTGAAGQLGIDLVERLVRGGDEVAALSRRELDVTDADAVAAAVGAARPAVVFNCAARTAVDACESDPEGSFAVNAHAVGHLAQACDAVGAHLVTISTDYVFDGAKGSPYLETDAPRPLSVYGRTKLAGEQQAGPDATVIRTSLVCGRHGDNAVKTMLSQLRGGSTLRYVNDQTASPTFAADLAAVAFELSRERPAGVFHVTNGGTASRYDLACAVAQAIGLDPAERVVAISTSQIRPPRPAARPVYSVLDNAALREAGFAALRHFREPLAELIQGLNN